MKAKRELPDKFGRTECNVPGCTKLNRSKYGLCNAHYKLQMDRMYRGLIKEVTDLSIYKSGKKYL